MDSRSFVVLVAASMVVFSLINIILLTLISPARLVVRIIRFILTCVIAAFFIRGHNWTRWLTGIGAVLGLPFGIGGFFALPEKFSLLGIWGLVLIAYEGFLAYAVLLDKRVQDHFSPSSGF